MLIFEKKVELREHLSRIRTQKTTVGFVPTMGALHNGHLSLIEKSISENDITVVSIFVNPTQFNNPTDLEKYPRDIASDIQKIITVSDQIIVFAPSTNDIYSQNLTSETFDFDGLDYQLEGKHRPGHFDGVGTIVKKLFEIVQPTHAYFGEKDFQQLQIIKKMVYKNQLDVKVIACPIFREANGLAMSSRNERLQPKDRESAKLIFETLTMVKQKFKNKNLPITHIRDWVKTAFQKNMGFELEYFEIADEATFLPLLKRSSKKDIRAFIAVFVDGVRLIDTISLN